MEPVLADGIGRLLVELLRVRVLLAGDVGRHGDGELIAPELLEDGVAEGLVVERGGAERDERLAGGLLVLVAVGPGDPEGEQAKDAPRPLEPGQALPFPLEDREDARVERIARAEQVHGGLAAEVAHLRGVVPGPFGVGRYRLLHVVGEALPVEEAAADDLRDLDVGRHADRLADAVEKLLVRVVVALVLGVHLQLGRRDGDAERDVVLGSRFLRQALQEVVELGRQAGLARLADVVHQLVHEDERRLAGEHLADDVAGRGDALGIMLGDGRERGFAAELPGDLAPGGLAVRLAVAAAAVDHVELGADEDGDPGLGDGLDLGAGEDRVHASPVLDVLPAPGQVVEGGQRVGLAPAELGRHVEDGGGLDLDAGEPAHDLGGQVEQAPRHVGALEESLGLDVILVRPPITDVVEVDGEFRGVERPVLAEVFPGRDELVPGSEFCHRSHKPPGYRDFFARATGG